MNSDSNQQEMDWMTGAALMLICSAVLSTLVVYGSTWVAGVAETL